MSYRNFDRADAVEALGLPERHAPREPWLTLSRRKVFAKARDYQMLTALPYGRWTCASGAAGEGAARRAGAERARR